MLECKWPNGVVVKTYIQGDQAEDCAIWADGTEGKGASLTSTSPRPLTRIERYVLASADGLRPAVPPAP